MGFKFTGGSFRAVAHKIQEREEHVKRTVSGTRSLSLMRLKTLTQSLCDRDEELKTYINYMNGIFSYSLKQMEELKTLVDEGKEKTEIVSFIEDLISQIKKLKEKTNG